MYLLILSLVFSISSAQSSNGLKTFANYRLSAQKQAAITEARMINGGDKYVEEHAVASERLSLAELLPVTAKEFVKFCRTYPKDVLSYYDLGNVTNLKNVKSKVLGAYHKMVVSQCRSVRKI